MQPKLLTRARSVEITKILYDDVKNLRGKLNKSEERLISTIRRYMMYDWILTDKQLVWLKDIHQKYTFRHELKKEDSHER